MKLDVWGHRTVATGKAEVVLGTEGRAGLCLPLPRPLARLQTHHTRLLLK